MPIRGIIDRLARVEPARFNRACAAIALCYLIVTILGRLMISRSNQDFPQYYMGGSMARIGAWDSLYPTPLDRKTRNPGFLDGSVMKPRYAEEVARGNV